MDRHLGRSLIDNLYATLIALAWPFTFFNKEAKEIIYDSSSLIPFFSLLFAYVFICDDFYTSQRALNYSDNISKYSWRNFLRFWLDLLILACFFGFTLSSFTSPYLVYLIIVAYLLGWWWCHSLRTDIIENGSHLPNIAYVFHLERQQRISCYILLVYTVAEILKKAFDCVVIEGNKYIFDGGTFNLLTILKMIVNVQLLYILWFMIIANWLLRFIAMLSGPMQNKYINELIIRINKFIDGKPRKFFNASVKLIKSKKFIFLTLLAVSLAFLSSEKRAFCITLIVLTWYLREFINGEGLFYEANLLATAKQKSLDINTVESVIGFFEEVKSKS